MTVVVHGQAGTHTAATHDDSVDCPECSGFVKTYKLRLSSGMARDLLFCHQQHGTQRFFLPVLLEGLSADFLRLRHWGFISECPDSEQCWSVTEMGEQWLLGLTDAPECALFYNGCLVKMTEDDRVVVTGVLGKGFRYVRTDTV